MKNQITRERGWLKHLSERFRIISIVIFMLFLFFAKASNAAIYIVTSNSNAGLGSLRAALLLANSNPGFDTINFNNPSPFVIQVLGTLAAFNVHINGASHPSYRGKPIVVLDGNNVGGVGIAVNGGTGTIITALVIQRFPGPGIAITSVNNNTIKGCIIGLDSTGNSVSANAIGILLNSSNANTIGGVSGNEKNIISGNNSNGIELDNSINNSIINNFIGLNFSGTTAIGNLVHGILISSSNNTIVGGNDKAYRNVISGNGSMGIQISNSSGTLIQSNYIGTTSNGTAPLGNKNHGIQAQQSPFTIIGGNYYKEGNLICASKFHGIILDQNSHNSIVKGNCMGTDITLTQNLKNGSVGIVSKASDNVVIGGVNNKEFNVSCFNAEYGILVANGSYNSIEGNFVGTDTSGTKNLGNNFGGICIRKEDNPYKDYNNVVLYNTIAYNGYLFPSGDPNVAVNKGPGIALTITEWDISRENTETKFTLMRYNSIFCNAGKGIDLNQNSSGTRLGNNNKVAPRINASLSTNKKIVGFTDPSIAGDLIDIYFMDDKCSSCDINPQGKIFVDTLRVSSDGSWTYDYKSIIPGKLVATATDITGNTSEFSLCYTPCAITPIINPTAQTIVNLSPTNTFTYDLSSAGSISVLSIDSMHYFISKEPSVSWSSYSHKDTSISFSHRGLYSTGEYNLALVLYSKGCVDTATTKFIVDYLFIPNLVTPNGDNHNDQFFITDVPNRYTLSIYNRWGDRIYERNGYTDQWDLSQVSEGVYYYLITDSRSDKEYKGWVEILGKQ